MKPIQSYFDDFKEWLEKPYSDDLTVFGWVMFLGLVTAITFLWASVIGQIKRAAG